MQTFGVNWYHRVPLHVKGIIERLNGLGRRTYVVGGAVRDLWLGLDPKDFDLVSEASVEEVEGAFAKTTGVGRQFGIMVVVTEKGPVEVARFRADGNYTDSRHPSEITFTDPDEDARRRDFTLNALFYDPAAELVIDYVGGVADLEARTIRCVGDPAQRFGEDALRMLRAVRLRSQLANRNFHFAEGLVESIRPLAGRLAKVSRERVTQEMEKSLTSLVPSLALKDLQNTGLWEPVLLAPLPAGFDPNGLERAVAAHRKAFGPREGSSLPLAFLEAKVPGFLAEKALLISKSQKAALRHARALRDLLPAFDAAGLASKKRILLHPEFELGWAVYHHESQEDLPALKKEWEQAGRLNPPALLNGEDLIAEGVAPGKEIRALLEALREEQLGEKIRDKNEALAWLRARRGQEQAT